MSVKIFEDRVTRPEDLFRIIHEIAGDLCLKIYSE
jgi:hypothetical protein